MDFDPDHLLGPPVAIKAYDCNTVTLEEFKAAQRGVCTLPVSRAGEGGAHMNAVIGWFTADFFGSEASPADSRVTLTTAPSPVGATHWGQQEFIVSPPKPVVDGDAFRVAWEVDRQRVNQRLLDVRLRLESAAGPATEHKYRVD